MHCLITSNGWPRSASIVIWIGWSISSWEILLHTIVLQTNQSSGENNQKTRVKGNTTQQGWSGLIAFSLDFNCQPPPMADLLFLACRRRLPIWRRDETPRVRVGKRTGGTISGSVLRRDGMESCGQLSSLLRGFYRNGIGLFVLRNSCRLFVGYSSCYNKFTMG